MSPIGITVDDAGHVFVTDGIARYVQKFTPTGELLARWGGGGTAPGFFYTPFGIACDPHQNVFVVDHHNYRIQKFTNDGGFLTLWGSKGTEPGQFASSHGMTVDSRGRIYILDFGNEGFVQCYTYPAVSGSRVCERPGHVSFHKRDLAIGDHTVLPRPGNGDLHAGRDGLCVGPARGVQRRKAGLVFTATLLGRFMAPLTGGAVLGYLGSDSDFGFASIYSVCLVSGAFALIISAKMPSVGNSSQAPKIWKHQMAGLAQLVSSGPLLALGLVEAAVLFMYGTIEVF